METGLLDAEMFIQRPDFDAYYDPHTPDMRQADAAASLAVGNPVSIEYIARSETRLSRIYTRARNDLWKLQTARLGHPPVLNNPQPQPETENSTNEPGQPRTVTCGISVNYLEPETFAWISTVTPPKASSQPPSHRPDHPVTPQSSRPAA
jgi:hypothetical protein